MKPMSYILLAGSSALGMLLAACGFVPNRRIGHDSSRRSVMRNPVWLVLVVLLVAVLACESSSSSGSAVGGSQSCNRSGNTGTCAGTFSTLSGTYTKKFEAQYARTNDEVPVEISVTVEQGTVRVSVKAPDGTVATADATPGSPASLSGISTGNNDEFPVTFEAVGGDVTGVSYSINYEVP